MEPSSLSHSLASEYLSLSRSELRARLRAGHPVAPDALEGFEYRGISLGLPAFVVARTWLTFRKTFYRCPVTGSLRGWNVRLRQTGLDGAREPLLRAGHPHTFGHYVVKPIDGMRAPLAPAGALLIDYGWNGMRDPLVALEPGGSERLLGFTYLALGPLRIETPSFFLLEREGPISFVPA